MELPKAFNHADHEQKLYSMWEKSGAFKPDNSSLEISNSSFSIVMPPPNANGALHIGHAVFVALEDLMVRYHRMRGEPTLWLPGADHAGFETQVVFEKKLEKEGKTRFQFGREELYKKMWDFTQENKKNMESQLRRLGASSDWSRAKFTLDPDIVKIVYETFTKLYKDGLAYRDLGIVNWCPKHQTSLSDLEVKHVEQRDPLYYLNYGPFTIATTRPETKFGDKYVVVHPKDKRYLKYKQGQQFDVQWLNGKVKATLIKDDAIDMAFGTGAMTITPAHDHTDFDIAKRHKLDIEQVIDQFGKLLPIAGEFAGQHIKKARPAIIEKLKGKGLLKKVDEKYVHSVAVCYKCNTAIEPQVLKQWFIAMRREIKSEKLPAPAGGKGKSLQDLGLQAIIKKEVIFTNKKFEKIYRHWLNNIRDWNISRQIVWGIPINAWYCNNCGHTQVAAPKTVNVIAIRHGQAQHNTQNIFSGDPINIYNLTELGKKQSQDLKEKLKDHKIDAIFASEFLRTQETAETIVLPHKLNVKIDKRLNDLFSGKLEGKSFDKIRNLVKGWTKSIDGSETISQVESRVVDFFEEISQTYEGKTVAIVSSEIILHTLQRIVWGLSLEKADDDYFENAEFRELKITLPMLCEKCGGFLARDKDVFDTWFSSGQWPFATLRSRSSKKLKVKSEKSDFDNFYPTSVMETGHDILFFWVARMVMLGKYATGKAPFKHVYLHGLVRDQDRQKMSKSKGNVVDPLGVIDQYGTDALRMALVFGVAGGNDIIISEEKIRGMRNFANKVWNVARFILNRELKAENLVLKIKPKTNAEKQLDKEIRQLIIQVTQNIDTFRFHEAAETLYSFIWHKFADVHLEAAKRNEISFNFLLYTFNSLLKLLHPFMPFVTEAIWQELYDRKLVKEPMLISAPWPQN